MSELKFHTLADIFPLMEGDEFDALVADIKANGQREPIVLYQGKILDGRNRYRACLAAGVGIKLSKHNDDCPYIGDPVAYVISKNIHRRHLTAEQKRNLIARLLKASPEKSNNAIAKESKLATDKTVAAVRRELEATSEIPKLKKTIGADGKARKRPAKKKARTRYEREQKKQADLINGIVRESQSAIDALVARLVELDPKVARGVLEAIAMFGPCGAVEGPNFVLALPFALALEAALNAAAPAERAAPDDGLDIPESLRRAAAP
jgi:hypothetical protein